MSDNELLFSISDLMDKKLRPLNDKMNLLEANMNLLETNMNLMETNMNSMDTNINNNFNRIYIILENEVRPNIKLLAENYLPSAIRYEKQLSELENIQYDIDILKKVVAEHSEKLQKIS